LIIKQYVCSEKLIVTRKTGITHVGIKQVTTWHITKHHQNKRYEHRESLYMRLSLAFPAKTQHINSLNSRLTNNKAV